MKIFRILLSLLLSFLFFCPVWCSFENGLIEEGEIYGDEVKKTNSYSIIQFPFGTSFRQMYNNYNDIMMLVQLTPCPGGSECQDQNSKNLFILYKKERNLIERVRPLIYNGTLISKDIFYGGHSFGAFGYGLFFSEKNYTLMKIEMPSGRVTNRYPLLSSPSSDVPLGGKSGENGFCFLRFVDYIQVLNEQLKLVNELSYRNMARISAIGVSAKTRQIYVVGRTSSVRWTVFKSDYYGENMSTFKIDLKDLDSSSGYELVLVINDDYESYQNGVSPNNYVNLPPLYMVFKSPHTPKTFLYHISSNFSRESYVSFDMNNISSYEFDDSSSRTFFLFGDSKVVRTTINGGVIRYQGEMTFWDEKNKGLDIGATVYLPHTKEILMGTRKSGKLLIFKYMGFIDDKDEYYFRIFVIIGSTLISVLILIIFTILVLYKIHDYRTSFQNI